MRIDHIKTETKSTQQELEQPRAALQTQIPNNNDDEEEEEEKKQCLIEQESLIERLFAPSESTQPELSEYLEKMTQIDEEFEQAEELKDENDAEEGDIIENILPFSCVVEHSSEQNEEMQNKLQVIEGGEVLFEFFSGDFGSSLICLYFGNTILF